MNIESALTALKDLYPKRTFFAGEHPQTGVPCIFVEFEDMAIYDPTLSEDEMSRVHPSHYGLSREAADIMKGFY